jgi:hypothetical protein
VRVTDEQVFRLLDAMGVDGANAATLMPLSGRGRYAACRAD